MKKLAIILIIAVSTISCGPNVPDDLKHNLIEKVTFDKRSENCKIEVVISRKANEEELKALANHYKSFCPYDKIWIFYYTEGNMGIAYGTTHFNPNITIDIIDIDN